jgi:hypothetical protein
MTVTAIEAQRLVGKCVLFLAPCWIMAPVAGIVGATRGTQRDPLILALFLIRGCAFVPAAYYCVQLHRYHDAADLNHVWPKVVVYGVAGLVLLAGTAYSVFAAGRSLPRPRLVPTDDRTDAAARRLASVWLRGTGRVSGMIDVDGVQACDGRVGFVDCAVHGRRRQDDRCAVSGDVRSSLGA